jgi:tRNA uridine 5-carboxymethylaminomethyl modification enzyme
VNPLLFSRASEPIEEAELLSQILKRSEIMLADVLSLEATSGIEEMQSLKKDPHACDALQFEVKYEGYLARQEEQIRLFEKSESLPIPEQFDFLGIRSLSAEGKEKLQKVRPRSIGQASRISGVTPADISILMISVASGRT